MKVTAILFATIIGFVAALPADQPASQPANPAGKASPLQPNNAAGQPAPVPNPPANGAAGPCSGTYSQPFCCLDVTCGNRE